LAKAKTSSFKEKNLSKNEKNNYFETARKMTTEPQLKSTE